MTVVLMGAIQTWVGLSTDTKPTAPPAGSTFYETDTGATYIYDGSVWQLRLGQEGAFRATKTATFDGTANKGQAGTNTTLFTITGEIIVVRLVPYCTTLLDQAMATATVALGVTGSTALFIAATTSTDIDANEFWVDTGPDANGIALPAALKDIVITDDILVAAATQDTNAGVIEFTLYWLPLSSDGLAVAA